RVRASAPLFLPLIMDRSRASGVGKSTHGAALERTMTRAAHADGGSIEARASSIGRSAANSANCSQQYSSALIWAALKGPLVVVRHSSMTPIAWPLRWTGHA